MLQRYFVHLWIFAWIMKYCHPKLASAGVITAFPVVTLVGANKHFWRRCRGGNRVKSIGKVVNKFEIGIRLLNRLTWLCFLVFVDMKTG